MRGAELWLLRFENYFRGCDLHLAIAVQLGQVGGAGDVTLNETGATGTVSVPGSGRASRTVTIPSNTADESFGISLASATSVESLGNVLRLCL